MNTCQNPECQKPLTDENRRYCDEECVRKHQEIKKQAKSKPQSAEYPRKNGENKEQTVNVGTENKDALQNQSLKFMKTYPKDRTKKQYARLLCWNIRVSQRTAMENYIEPMIEHGILVPSGDNRYRLSPEYE